MKAHVKAIPEWAILKLLFVLLAAMLMTGAARADGGIDSWSALQTTIDGAQNRAVITLPQDLTALETDVALNIPAGKCLTLDLNGHALNRNRKKRDVYVGSAIHIEAGAVLTLRDSVGTGVITGGSHDNGGGIANNGTMILMGGCVTGNTSMEQGGGVFNHAKARLTMDDGIVFDNTAPKHNDIANEGTLTVIGAGNGEVHIEDMPVLRRFMAQQAILPTAVLLIALLLAVWLDDYLGRDRKRGMVIIIALVFSLMVQNYLDNRLSSVGAYNALRVPVAIYGYAVRLVILAMFLTIGKPDGRYRAVWALGP